MKITHIITSLNTGGAQTMLQRLQDALPQHQHDVVSLKERGAIAPVLKELSEKKPDIIQSWMYHSNLSSMLGRWLTFQRTPLIWSIRHGLYDYSSEKPRTRFVIKAGATFSRMPRAIIYNSEIVARQHEALGYDASKTIIIPNGFEVFDTPYRPQNAEIKIGMIARWHALKDHANMIEAFRILRERHDNVRLVLAGTYIDERNAELLELLDNAGVTRYTTLMGEQKDMGELMSGLDIAALSSKSESFPNVLGEAMACGVPCVATDVGEAGNLVGNTGLIAPPQNPAALAEGLRQLVILSPTQRHEMGARAKKRIQENYSINDVARKYADLYEEVCA